MPLVGLVLSHLTPKKIRENVNHVWAEMAMPVCRFGMVLIAVAIAIMGILHSFSVVKTELYSTGRLIAR